MTPSNTWRGFVMLTVAALAVIAVLVSLGNWQVRRLSWKTALIATVNERIVEPARPLPPPRQWQSLNPEATDYSAVTLTGHFLGRREFHVFANLAEPKGKMGGVGWWVFAPFQLQDGGIVFVNRGFVPDQMKDPSTRPEPATVGDMTLSGILRRPEGRNVFTPADLIDRNQWFTRDPLPMAAALGLKPDSVLPFYVDADAHATPPSGLPQGGETVVNFPNDHLGYAITWYGLALACAGVYLALVWRRRGVS
ncbi:MAG: SURF1 family protein [Ancalomicrobiaceae bacterium]|nr:SURF1 family protein [Ancalomicrobiaceae bacterium]